MKAFISYLCLVAMCVQPAVAQEPREEKWYVYRDSTSKENHGVWSNFMPAEAGKIIKLSLVHQTDPQAGDSCIRVDVKWQEPFWAGVAVSCAANYWGETASATAFDLRRAKKLVFFARGARGGESIQAKVAIAGDKTHGDSARHPAETEWLVLTKSWKRFEIDLTGKNLERVITPFTFVSSKDRSPGDFTFFLDEIYFVMDSK